MLTLGMPSEPSGMLSFLNDPPTHLVRRGQKKGTYDHIWNQIYTIADLAINTTTRIPPTALNSLPQP